MKISLKFLIRPSKKLANGKYILFLRVIVNRQVKYYSQGSNYACLEKEWDDKNQCFKKNFDDYENANIHLKTVKRKADKVFIELGMTEEEFTIFDFDLKFKSDPNTLNIISFFDEVIGGMIQNNYGNSRVFSETKNAVKRFLKNKKNGVVDYPMINITPSFLKEFEGFLREVDPDTKKPKCGDTTVSIRLRTIRRLFNVAREENKITHYPFEEFSLKHLSKKTAKRAIKAEDIKKIFEYKTEEDSRKFASLQYFKFMFYMRGMNFTDMALLTKNGLPKEGDLKYIRAKTKKEISLPIIDQAQEIIEWFKSGVEESPYVFPILLPQHKTQKQKKDRIKTILGRMNKDLKSITEDLKLEIPISSYYSRHSFATILKHMNVPIAQISELLAHESISTTEIYLDEFESEELNKVANDMYDKIDKLKL